MILLISMYYLRYLTIGLHFCLNKIERPGLIALP